MFDATEAIPMQAPPPAPARPEEKPKESILESVPDPAQTRGGEEKSKQEQNKQEPKKAGPATKEQKQAEQTLDEHSPPIKAPHIDPPPYIHHFDTYGLVRRLKEGGWEGAQAITVMKAVRLMLADNTNLAREALVSKSNLENEAYLFKAA